MTSPLEEHTPLGIKINCLQWSLKLTEIKEEVSSYGYNPIKTRKQIEIIEPDVLLRSTELHFLMDLYFSQGSNLKEICFSAKQNKRNVPDLFSKYKIRSVSEASKWNNKILTLPRIAAVSLEILNSCLSLILFNRYYPSLPDSYPTVACSQYFSFFIPKFTLSPYDLLIMRIFHFYFVVEMDQFLMEPPSDLNTILQTQTNNFISNAVCEAYRVEFLTKFKLLNFKNNNEKKVMTLHADVYYHAALYLHLHPNNPFNETTESLGLKEIAERAFQDYQLKQVNKKNRKKNSSQNES